MQRDGYSTLSPESASTRRNSCSRKGTGAAFAATVTPEDATDKTVTWSTSNGAVAAVNGGKITAAGGGSATVTATAANGKDGGLQGYGERSPVEHPDE